MYEQRTQKLYDGQTEWLMPHWENGFIRILESGEPESVNAQVSRSEVLLGTVESRNDKFKIHFLSKTITSDPHMVSSARRFKLGGDMLRCEMEMQTTKVGQMTQHLKITLERAK